MNLKGQKKILIGLGILVLCIFTLIIVKINAKQEKTVLQAPLVKTLKVSASNKDSEYVYAGEVRSRFESQLAFRVSGKIISRNVEEGSRVHAGDVLMQLDPRDAQQSVDNYAAQIASAQSQLTLAEDTLNRSKKLYENGALSKADLDSRQNTYNVAEALLKQLNALYTATQNQLEYTTLRADRDGVISGIYAEVGQVVLSSATAQTVVTLAQDKDLEIEINVPENRIDQIKKTNEINVSFWALPEVKVRGALREVSPAANKVSRTYRVRISLINPPSTIQIGMSSNVSISENNSSGKIWIPVAAVYQKASSPQVWIVKENTVSLKNITIEDFNGDLVAVSAGLGEGDVVVTAGVNSLREGQEVRIGSDN